MRPIGRWLPRALFESFLIVLSILLALAVNEWRDNAARAKRANEARVALLHEIAANRELLRSDVILPHHRRLQSEYVKLNAERSTASGSLFDSGVHPAALRDAAWRSFSASAILIDFKPQEVVLLSDIYRAQEDLEKLNSGFLATMQTPRSDRETPEFLRDSNRSIAMYLNDLVPLEERILKQYDRALEDLD